MATLIKVTPTNTYATEENAIKAANRAFPSADLKYFINQADDGRYFPVFIGAKAIEAGVHFKFNVVG